MHKKEFEKRDSIFILFEFRKCTINEIFCGLFVLIILKITLFSMLTIRKLLKKFNNSVKC